MLLAERLSSKVSVILFGVGLGHYLPIYQLLDGVYHLLIIANCLQSRTNTDKGKINIHMGK